MNGIPLNDEHEKDIVRAVRAGNTYKLHYVLNKCPVDTNCERYFDYALVKEALIYKHVNTAKYLIEEGFRVSKSNLIKWEKTVLHYASEFEDAELIQILLTRGASSDINRKTLSEETPLHIAIRKGNIRVVEVFLSNFDLKSLKVNEHCYLHYAIRDDDIKAFKLLLEKGFSPLVKDVDNMTPFCLALAKKKFNFLNILMCHYDVTRIDHSSYDAVAPFFVASICGNLNFIRRMLNSGFSINSRVEFNDFDDWSALENCYGLTALHLAVKYDERKVLKYLLNEGASVMIQGGFGNTPIHTAFSDKNYRVLDYLLLFHLNFKLNPTNVKGISHFHIACTRNIRSIVKNFILYTDSIDTRVTDISETTINPEDESYDWQGYTPLHFAILHNKVKIVKLLLERNADVHVEDENGCTPLHLACQNNYKKFREFIFDNYKKKKIDWLPNRKAYLEIIKLLLQYKADVNCLDNFGHGPVYYACNYFPYKLREDLYKEMSPVARTRVHSSLSDELCSRRRIILDILFVFNVNPDKSYNNGSILHYMCIPPVYSETINLITFFLKKGADINATDDKMLTPLHLSVTKGNSKVLVKVLLDYNANLNFLGGKDLETPLHYALTNPETCTYKTYHFIDLLLQKGANVHIKDTNGDTFLHLYVRYIQFINYPLFIPLIHKYIKPNEKMNVKNDFGDTLLFCALKCDNYVIIGDLLYLGADVNIEDSDNRTVFCYIYDKIIANEQNHEWELQDYGLIKAIHILNCHVSKMNIIGKVYSKKLMESKAKLKALVKDLLIIYDIDKEEEVIEKCKKELEFFKRKKIDDKNSLYDVLFKDENSMANHVKNAVFRFLLSKNNDWFYIDVLRMKFYVGLMRRKLLPLAKYFLNFLTIVRMPDMCSENIFKYFTNSELTLMIDSLSPLENEREFTDFEIPLRVRTTEMKYQKVG